MDVEAKALPQAFLEQLQDELAGEYGERVMGKQTLYRLVSELLAARTSTAPVAEPFCYVLEVRDWMGDMNNAPEQGYTDFSDVPMPGYEPLYRGAPPPPQPGVRVTELAWRKFSDVTDIAQCVAGEYRVFLDGERWFVWLNDAMLLARLSRDEAKAAAQADYETRIRSALTASIPDTGEVWQLVPVEPTEEIEEVYVENHASLGFRALWAAMLAASPQPQPQGDGGKP